ncbi:hypothetical protein BpHYR1_023509 [Brachionus plicatilis]|uniref:Uncharacterized protein n=1 Tax=Brachionus plicatilis TaxID=10195 RepID=A0A3M7P4Z3_BRAPC|nr:hypothetical protein BpHYR1_023509 [Brachionus plicatilis]
MTMLFISGIFHGHEYDFFEYLNVNFVEFENQRNSTENENFNWSCEKSPFLFISSHEKLIFHSTFIINVDTCFECLS